MSKDKISRSSSKIGREGSVDDEESFFASFSPKSAEAFKNRASIVAAIIEQAVLDGADAEESLSESAPASETNNVHGKKVMTRIRPFLSEEKDSHVKRIVSVTPGNKLAIINPSLCHEDPDKIANIVSSSTSSESAKVFQFTRCLWSFDNSKDNPREKAFVGQEGVHEALGKDIVDYAVKGVSVCCFAYGHTSSGKTHTMFGSKPPAEYGKLAEKPIRAITDDLGLIPRVAFDLASTLLRASLGTKIKINVSFMEIYNERIRDLLSDSIDDSGMLKVRESPVDGVFVEGLTKKVAGSKEALLQMVLQGHARRATAATSRNEYSSRSHAIVTLEIVHPEDAMESNVDEEGRPKKRTNIVRVQLTDLAGSEQDPTVGEESFGHSKSHRAEDNVLKNERKFIRTSLSTLSFIIQALDKPSAKNLPYRDSLLTWLLREALCGSSCTFVLATISPASHHYDESLLTLKYAQRLFHVGRKMRSVKSTFRTQQELSMMASFSNNLASGLSLRPSEVKKISKARAADRDDVEEKADNDDYWTEEFRNLRGQIIDLEVELTNARTDKDSLIIELEEARRAVVNSELLRKQALAEPPVLPHADLDKERYDLLAVIQSKDERIEKLLSDLNSERLDRNATEMAVVKQIHKLMDRIEELQIQLQSAEDAISQLKSQNHRSTSVDLAPLVEERVKEIKLEADRRVSQAEDAAQTAREALKMVMALNKG